MKNQVSSSAFPPGFQQTTFSEFHRHLKNCKSMDGPIVIRNFQQTDVQSLVKLQKQWFPIPYTEKFYKRLISKNVHCYLAVSEIQYIDLQDNQEKKTQIIVGAIIFQTVCNTDYLKKSSIWDYFSQIKNSVYIMTLGVIDQYRKRGVGKLLIQRLKQECQKYNQIKFIHLHVISYNEAAQKFYLKNGFLLLQHLQGYYHVNANVYQGRLLGMYINGGTKNQTWSQWFKKMIRFN